MKKTKKEERLKGAKDLLESKETVLIKKAKIIFDGRQYSIKIPKNFIEELGIDAKDYVIQIEVTTPPYHTGEETKLKMELVKK